ncbi:MAG: aspartate aminotransferase family protein [Candidatus Thorarchaeota archaeon]|nr:MAG: aspartate aminotransferase family protein [Candidatus Thorarchaeota archaeon]
MTDDLVPEELRKAYTDKEILAIEKKHLVPAVGHYYEDPILFVKGKGAVLEDSAGKEYIDLFAGICTTITGYSHPKFVATIKWQAEQLVYTSSLYSTIPYALLIKKLAEIAPAGLTQSYIVNSGSEANEHALFMARKYKQNPYVVACHHAYHGRTTLAREITTAGWRTVPEAHPPGVRFAPNGYCYRCQFGKEFPECDFECARYLREIIRTETNRAIAAFIAEPIQGVGGIVQPPSDYFKIVHEIVKDFDGLFISDEVQTGFGRTGEKWWGIEHSGVEPDVVTMAKGFGSGIPIGGFMTRPEIAEDYTMTDSFATFGGNPLSCAAALAVIEIIEESNYVERATRNGGHFKKELEALKEDHRLIGDVRGQGMMLGIELVRDRTTKEPASEEMVKLMELCKEDGLLIGKGGFDGNVIRLQPPLELTTEQIDKACEIIDKSLAEIEKSI